MTSFRTLCIKRLTLLRNTSLNVSLFYGTTKNQQKYLDPVPSARRNTLSDSGEEQSQGAVLPWKTYGKKSKQKVSLAYHEDSKRSKQAFFQQLLYSSIIILVNHLILCHIYINYSTIDS